MIQFKKIIINSEVTNVSKRNSTMVEKYDEDTSVGPIALSSSWQQ